MLGNAVQDNQSYRGISKAPSIDIRRALPSDADFLAKCFLQYSDGVMEYLWEKEGRVPQECWRHYCDDFKSTKGVLSHTNCLVAETENKVAGMTLLARLRKDDDSDRLSMILHAMNDLVRAGELHILALPAYEALASKDVAKALLQMAEAVAREKGESRLSALITSRHRGVCSFYENEGYQKQGSQQLPEDIGFPNGNGSLFLMSKTL